MWRYLAKPCDERKSECVWRARVSCDKFLSYVVKVHEIWPEVEHHITRAQPPSSANGWQKYIGPWNLRTSLSKDVRVHPRWSRKVVVWFHRNHFCSGWTHFYHNEVTYERFCDCSVVEQRFFLSLSSTGQQDLSRFGRLRIWDLARGRWRGRGVLEKITRKSTWTRKKGAMPTQIQGEGEVSGVGVEWTGVKKWPPWTRRHRSGEGPMRNGRHVRQFYCLLPHHFNHFNSQLKWLDTHEACGLCLLMSMCFLVWILSAAQNRSSSSTYVDNTFCLSANWRKTLPECVKYLNSCGISSNTSPLAFYQSGDRPLFVGI